MKYTIITFLMVVGTFPLQAQHVQPYIQKGLQLSAEVESKRQDYKAALKKLPQQKGMPDPKLGGGVFISPIETRVGPQIGRVGISQPIPWPGLLSQKEKVAVEQARQKYYEYLSTRLQLEKQVKVHYYKLYAVKRALQFTQENVQLAESLESLANRAYENGLTSQADAIRSRILTRELKIKAQNLQEDLDAEISSFREMMNAGNEYTVTVADSLPALHDSINIVHDTSRQYLNDKLQEMFNLETWRHHPELLASEAQQDQFRMQTRTAELKQKPQFNLGLDYIFTGERSDMDMPDNGKDAIMANIGLSIPLWSKKYKAEINEFKIRQNQVQSKQTALINRFNSDKATYISELANSIRKSGLYQAQIQDTKTALRFMRQDYAGGEAQFESLLTLHQKLLKYQINYTKALANGYQAMARLDYLEAQPSIEQLEEFNNE